MTNTRYSVYHIKEKMLQKEKQEREDLSDLDLIDRFLMLLVYYRLYITYTLAGFLFNLDQSSICRDIQKIGPAD